jgi:alpha-mannosidase
MSENLLDILLPHVKDAIYTKRTRIQDWYFTEDRVKNPYAVNLRVKDWEQGQLPITWGGYNKTLWFRATFDTPTDFLDKAAVILLDFPEGLVYVDGVERQGVDKYHPEILLAEKVAPHHTFSVAVEAYSGRKTEMNRFANAEIAILNRTAHALYHSLLTLSEYQQSIDHPHARELKEIIRRTIVYLKYFKPGGEEFPHAIGRAWKFLSSILENDFKTIVPGHVHLIGQSHIDVAWLWTFDEAVKKCGRTFSTALQLMDEFPDFRFMQSQAILYDYTAQHYPQIFDRMKKQIAEGRWEVEGSTWVEPDCNIPNGESLVRQILFGKRYFKQEFGIETRTMWLPDTFGFNWAMPQILKKSGIEYFFTTKLIWNDTNKFPMNSFFWQGIDGTKVLSHIPPLGLEALIRPEDIKRTWEEYQQHETSQEVIQTFGYGDGGGGPTKAQLQVMPIVRGLYNLPSSGISSLKIFFEKLSTVSTNLPVWNDELYLEKHRGTLTTHAWIKKENRECEILAYTAELLASVCTIHGTNSNCRKYPQSDIEKAWQGLLTNQFHDILPGTSIPEAYADVRHMYANIRTTFDEIIIKALEHLTDPIAKSVVAELTITLFNSLEWERAEYVEIVTPFHTPTCTVVDESGNNVDCQVISDGKKGKTILCYVENIPPYSGKTLTIRPCDAAPTESEDFSISERIIQTPIYKVRFDKRGQFSSIYNKTLKKEFLKKSSRANHFVAYRDTPKQWEAWDIDADSERHKLELLSLKSLTITEHGPLRATLHAEYTSPTGSVIKQNIRFYHKTSKIDFDTLVDWHEKQILLRTAFPLNLPAKTATFEIQFGVIERAINPTSPIEKAKFEVPVQQWMDISNKNCGASLLNDCKYGAGIVDGGLRLSLIRSPHYPHPIEPWHLNDNRVTDQGLHKFMYSFYSHKGDWRTGETARRARELNNPLRILYNRKRRDVEPLLHLSQPSIVIDAVKKAEDSTHLVIRMHESHGTAKSTIVSFGFPVKEIIECDLMENDLHPIKPEKNKLALKFKPFEIKTFKVLPKK